MSPSRLDEWLKFKGDVMAADDSFLSGDQIHNIGAILAQNSLPIEAGTFTNERRVPMERSMHHCCCEVGMPDVAANLSDCF